MLIRDLELESLTQEMQAVREKLENGPEAQRFLNNVFRESPTLKRFFEILVRHKGRRKNARKKHKWDFRHMEKTFVMLVALRELEQKSEKPSNDIRIVRHPKEGLN